MHTIKTKKYLLHLLATVRAEHVDGSAKCWSALCCALSEADDYSHCGEGDGVSWHNVSVYKEHLFRQWPEFSGRNSYPVTVAFESLTAEEVAAIEADYSRDDDVALDWSDREEVAGAIYCAVDRSDLYDGNFWDRATAYGAARWRLLEWMIEKVKEEISNEG